MATTDLAANWQKRVEAYAGDRKRKSQEDFAARKLLRGIGWVEKGLPILCSNLGLEFDPATPLFTTVLDVLDSLSGGWFSPSSTYRRFIVDVRDFPRSKAGWENPEIKTLAGMASKQKVTNGVIVLSKVDSPGTSAQCVATVLVNDCGMQTHIPPWLIMPVSAIKARIGHVSVWIRDAEALVRDMAAIHGWPVPERPNE